LARNRGKEPQPVDDATVYTQTAIQARSFPHGCFAVAAAPPPLKSRRCARAAALEGRPCPNSQPPPHPQPISSAFDKDGARIACARKIVSGDGFTQLRHLLGDFDALFVGNGRDDPIIVLTVDFWQRLVAMPLDPR
jgi:hypothetical protein